MLKKFSACLLALALLHQSHGYSVQSTPVYQVNNAAGESNDESGNTWFKKVSTSQSITRSTQDFRCFFLHVQNQNQIVCIYEYSSGYNYHRSSMKSCGGTCPALASLSPWNPMIAKCKSHFVNPAVDDLLIYMNFVAV